MTYGLDAFEQRCLRRILRIRILRLISARNELVFKLSRAYSASIQHVLHENKINT